MGLTDPDRPFTPLGAVKDADLDTAIADADMDSSIELPGEAAPLSGQNLISTLAAGVGSSQQHRQSATQQLDTWSNQPFYYDGLAHLFSDLSQPTELRAMAIILIKNGVDKSWRKRPANMKGSIPQTEKEGIKTKLLTAVLREPEDRLATLVGVVLSKIARYEFPNDWPTALSTDLLQPYPKDSLEFKRALSMDLQIIKELASVRLPRTKLSFQSSARELFKFLSATYSESLNGWGHGYDPVGDVNRIILLLKTLRHLFVSGFDHPNREQMLCQFWEQTDLLMFGNWPPWRASASTAGDSDLTHKIYYQIVKLHVKVAQAHPAAFVLLPNFKDLVNQHWGLSIAELGEYWQTTSAQPLEVVGDFSDEEDPLIVKIGLSSLLLFRECAKMTFNPVHTFSSHIAGEREERDQAVNILRSVVFTPEFASPIALHLMIHFFALRKTDLRDWEEAPDEWEQKLYGDSNAWEYSVRGCAEKLFLDLVINFKDVLVTQLVKYFNEVARGNNQNPFWKDSVLCAIGLAASVLYDKLDFNVYVEQSLLREVSIQEPQSNILRRRVAILLGQWVPVMNEGLNRKAVYRIFRLVLDPQDKLNDQVVRVAAGMQLKHVLDPFEFEVTGFLEDAPAIIRSLIETLRQTNTSEVKMGLLETLRVLTGKMESNIAPHADYMLQELSKFWVTTDTDLLINEAIVAILSAMVTSLKQEAVNYLDKFIPLISQVLTNEDMKVYLLAETLDLLAAILTQTPDPLAGQAQGLVTLISPLTTILDLGSEQVGQSLKILESYALLTPLQEVHFRLFAACQALLGTSNTELNTNVLRLLERVIQAETLANHTNGIQAMAKTMIDTDLLLELLAHLLESWEARQTTGPNRKRTEIYGVVETDYIAIIARLTLANANVLQAALQFISASGSNIIPADIATRLIEEILAHFDNVGDLARKKLIALSLTHLLCEQSLLGDAVRSHFQEILSIWTDVITELDMNMEDSAPGPRPRMDSLVTDYSISPSDPNLTPEYLRQWRFESADPVHTVSFPAFAREQFMAFVQKCGGEAAFQASFLESVDQEVIRAFQQLSVV